MSKEGQRLHHLVVEVDGERKLECDALNVSIRPEVDREFVREAFTSADGYEVVSKSVVIEAECPGEINRVENLFI